MFHLTLGMLINNKINKIFSITKRLYFQKRNKTLIIKKIIDTWTISIESLKI